MLRQGNICVCLKKKNLLIMFCLTISGSFPCQTLANQKNSVIREELPGGLWAGPKGKVDEYFREQYGKESYLLLFDLGAEISGSW